MSLTDTACYFKNLWTARCLLYTSLLYRKAAPHRQGRAGRGAHPAHGAAVLVDGEQAALVGLDAGGGLDERCV